MERCSIIFSHFFKSGRLGEEPKYGLRVLTNAKVFDMELEEIKKFTEQEYLTGKVDDMDFE